MTKEHQKRVEDALDGLWARILEAFGNQSPSEIGRALGVERHSVYKWRDGKSQPTLDNLLKIQLVTGSSLHWLLTGEGLKWVNKPSYEDANFDLDNLWERFVEAVGTDDVSEIASALKIDESFVAAWRNRESYPTAGIIFNLFGSADYGQIDISTFWLLTGQGSKDESNPKAMRRQDDNPFAFLAEYSLRINRKVGRRIDLPYLPRGFRQEDKWESLGQSVGRYLEEAIKDIYGAANKDRASLPQINADNFNTEISSLGLDENINIPVVDAPRSPEKVKRTREGRKPNEKRKEHADDPSTHNR